MNEQERLDAYEAESTAGQVAHLRRDLVAVIEAHQLWSPPLVIREALVQAFGKVLLDIVDRDPEARTETLFSLRDLCLYLAPPERQALNRAALAEMSTGRAN